MDVRIFTEPQEGASYDQLLAVARAAEDCGFDAFFRSDHLLAMGGDGLPGPTDAWVTLAGLARDTSRIRLGTLVTPATFRLPGLLAVQVAQVDQMSGGRVELGLGAGWFEREHSAYGLPFPAVRERFDRLEEQLDVVTGLWGTPVGERFSYSGRHYALTDCPALPKPVQSPLPIILGGGGKTRTPVLAARFATEFNLPFADVEAQRQQFGRVRLACERVGRSPESLVWSTALTVCLGRDDREVARRAAAIGRSTQDMGGGGLAGTPAQLVDAVSRYVQAGTQRLYLQVLDLSDLDHVELLGSQVLPQLAPLRST